MAVPVVDGEIRNPWLRQGSSGGGEENQPWPLTGPARPQGGVEAKPGIGLPIQATSLRPACWLVGAHGGAGVTTLSGLGDGWEPAHQWWPAGDQVSPVVVVARSNVSGLTHASEAATQWASGSVRNIELLGLVIVADCPGRLPRALRELTAVVAGGFPRVWRIEWSEDWRYAKPSAAPRSARRFADALQSLIDVPNNNPKGNKQ